MPRNPTGLAAAAAKRRWNEGIKFDFKTLFVGLGKSLAKLSYLDFLGSAAGAADAIKTVGKKTDPRAACPPMDSAGAHARRLPSRGGQLPNPQPHEGGL